MLELVKTKRITIAILAFVIFLLIGFVTLKQPVYSYKVDAFTLSEELSSIYQVTPDEAMELMYDSSLALFIDIRNHYDFEMGHLENAINIPIPDLLQAEYKGYFDKALRDSLVVVLYGNDELQANAPWMLLYELGYTNVRLLLGGYSYIDRMYLGELKENESYNAEEAAYNFAKVLEEAKNITPVKEEKVEVKKKVKVLPKPKKAAEGGC